MFDTVASARSLMGLSLVFHIVFATFGIGLPLLLLIAEGLWLRTGNQVYRQMAKRWSRVTVMLFAIGAVSGTIMSFELGLLWPTWMEFSGGIVGFAFTLEGVAFFTEAIFLGMYIFGWNRLSPVAHWLCAFPLALASGMSAFLVISVNGWMNQPDGFDFDPATGAVTNIDPVAAMFNGAMPTEIAHGWLAAYVATAFAVAGVYAFGMLLGDRSEYTKRALVLALAVGAVFAPLQAFTGDMSARFVAENEPEKFAAMEGQFETEEGAPLRIGGIPDTGDKTTRLAIELPKMGSFLAFRDFDAEVQGLNDFPQDEIPDAPLVHFPFQAMVGIGFFLLLLVAWFWGAALITRRFDPSRLLLLALVIATPLGMIALEAGWLVTEFGRQPWVIYQVMRTDEAATPRDGIGVLLVLFTLLYVLLTAALAFLVWRERTVQVEPAAAPEGAGNAA